MHIGSRDADVQDLVLPLQFHTVWGFDTPMAWGDYEIHVTSSNGPNSHVVIEILTAYYHWQTTTVTK
jgi:hypothetical protein